MKDTNIENQFAVDHFFPFLATAFLTSLLYLATFLTEAFAGLVTSFFTATFLTDSFLATVFLTGAGFLICLVFFGVAAFEVFTYFLTSFLTLGVMAALLGLAGVTGFESYTFTYGCAGVASFFFGLISADFERFLSSDKFFL